MSSKPTLRDIAEAQDPETGFVPMTAPCHWTPDKVDPVCSSFVESAWNLHLYCGERMLLRELFPNFLAWCRCMENAAENHILIDGGEIVQSGTHDELMHQGGIYRRFVESRELAVGWKV